MKESINKFIERKKDFLESREGHVLNVHDKLITIDGVDGSGKDTIADYLLAKMKAKFGDENIVKIDVTHFLDVNGNVTNLGNRVTGNDGHVGYFNEIYELSNEENKTELESKNQQIDKAYIAGVNRAYIDKVIPALKQGKYVIIPRSELNLVRYALQENDQAKIDRELKYLLDGTTTAGVLAGNRVFVSVSPYEMMQNISSRGSNSSLDPKDLVQAEMFTSTEKEAEDLIANLPTDKEINVIRIDNHVVKEGHLKEHLEKLCDEIISKININ